MRKLSTKILFTPCCANCSFHVQNERKDKHYCVANAPELLELTERMEICPRWEMSIIHSRRIAKHFFEGDAKSC